MKEDLSILIIDHNPDDLLFLVNSLNKLQTKDITPQLFVTDSLEKAQQALVDKTFDLIITDLFLPDSEGLDTFIELQERAVSIPIIIVGSSTDEELIRETIKLGAQDYLPKDDLTAELLSRMIHLAIERHRLHESLKALSFKDELTGLYNRRGFFTLLDQQISLSRRTKKGFFLFLVDLDYLKQINDTYGHLMGDQALIDMAQCLRASFRRHDIIGRIGGDEFAIIAIQASVENGDDIKKQMINRVQEYNSINDAPYHIAFSIGKAFYDGISDTPVNALVQQADKEMYEEKRISHSSPKL